MAVCEGCGAENPAGKRFVAIVEHRWMSWPRPPRRQQSTAMQCRVIFADHGPARRPLDEQ
jgi:hypothetical protein